MNETLYQIAHWDENFETSETRKLKVLSWVPTPNKHDGLGFRRLAAEKDVCELFAAWNLLLQIASRGKPGTRGLLARDGVALTAADLALMSGFPERIFTRALEFFSHPRQGWLLCGPVRRKESRTGVEKCRSRWCSSSISWNSGGASWNSSGLSRRRNGRKGKKGRGIAAGCGRTPAGPHAAAPPTQTAFPVPNRKAGTLLTGIPINARPRAGTDPEDQGSGLELRAGTHG